MKDRKFLSKLFDRGYSANPDIVARINEFLILGSKLDKDTHSSSHFKAVLTALDCNDCTITWGSTTNDLVLHKYESPEHVGLPKELVYMTLFPDDNEDKNFNTDFGIYVLDSESERNSTPFNISGGINNSGIIGCEYYNLGDLKYSPKSQPILSPAVVVKFLSQSSNSAVQVKEILDYRNGGCVFKMVCRKLLADLEVTINVGNPYTLKHLFQKESVIADVLRTYSAEEIDKVYADLKEKVFDIDFVLPENSPGLDFKTVRISYLRDKIAAVRNLEATAFSDEELPCEKETSDEILVVNGVVESYLKTNSQGQKVMLFKCEQALELSESVANDDFLWDWEYDDTQVEYHHKDGKQSFNFKDIPDQEAMQVEQHTKIFENILEITKEMKWIFKLK